MRQEWYVGWEELLGKASIERDPSQFELDNFLTKQDISLANKFDDTNKYIVIT